MKKKPDQIRAILLDRDGVINEEPGPILEPSSFHFIPGSIEAIARINHAGWLCLLVTNQSALARGKMELADFAKVTWKMNQSLFDGGARLDAMYFCPHHPEWENGNRRKSIKLCECRKPGTLLLERAAKENNFSANEAVFIGDSSTDFEAAAKWGTTSVGVLTGNSSRDGDVSFEPDYWKKDLWEAVDFLLESY